MEVWGDMGRCGKVWGYAERFGEVWGDAGRYGEVWGDAGTLSTAGGDHSEARQGALRGQPTRPLLATYTEEPDSLPMRTGHE